MDTNELPPSTNIAARPSKILQPAKLDWQGNTPRSSVFNDVYYSNLGGLAEAEHVFVNGNDLPARFSALKNKPDTTCFSIAELGFGTGLNIIAIVKAWRARGHQKGRLHITSFEGYPLHRTDFSKAQKITADYIPELADICYTLTQHYPPLTSGCFQCPLDDTVHLSVFWDDIARGITRLSGPVHAWLLDGFAPSKNPEMWTPHIMAHIRRLSVLGTSVATFSVAGTVRRSLIESGFDVQKTPGFGRKRHMLKGQLRCADTPSIVPVVQPWFAPPRSVATNGRVGVVGAGIAGACLAYHLQRAGLEPILIDGTGVAQGASGNPGGLIMPRLDLGATPQARLYKDAYLYALDFYQHLNSKQTNTTSLAFSACGGHMVANNKAQSDKHDALLATQLLPVSHCQRVSDAIPGTNISTSTAKDALTHLYFPQAGVLHPQFAISILIEDVQTIKADLLSATPNRSGWQLHLTDGQTLTTDQLVYTAGAHCAAFLHDPSVPLQASLGQVDVCEIDATTRSPETIVTCGAYIAPLPSRHVLAGATHTYHDIQLLPRICPQPTPAHSARILSDIQRQFALSSLHTVTRRASWRCTTPDQQPIMGAIPDWQAYQVAYAGLATGDRCAYPVAPYASGAYCLTGLGARGLVTAPLLAYQLCQLMTGGVVSLGQEEINLLHPARFLIRAIKRRSI